jgi:hypothetical protein
MSAVGVDLSDVALVDLDGHDLRLGDHLPRYLVLQVMRYYG